MFGFPTHLTTSFGEFRTKLNESEFVLFGVPIDQKSTGRKAILNGPDCIRRASIDLECISLRFNINYDDLKVSDIGNVITLNFEEALETVYEIVNRINKISKKSVMIGGEHTFTLPAVKAMNPTHLIVFDAHFDLRNEYLGERISHTTYLRRLIEELTNLKVICLGVRGFCREERDFADEIGVLHVFSRDLIKNFSESVKKLENFARKAKSIYISIDLDVLDPAYMPEVANPEPEGLTPTMLMDIFTLFKGKPIVGFDVMELSPSCGWNPAHHLAAKIVYELMAAIHVKI